MTGYREEIRGAPLPLNGECLYCAPVAFSEFSGGNNIPSKSWEVLSPGAVLGH